MACSAFRTPTQKARLGRIMNEQASGTTNTLNMISVNGNKEPTLERAMHYYIEEVSHRMV
jgi:hypothetical protein